MNQKKLRVGLLFGGNSGEHDISLVSASAVMQHLDKDKYDITPIGITRTGTWLPGIDPTRFIGDEEQLHANDIECREDKKISDDISISVPLAKRLFPCVEALDIVFPVLHGTGGEDGTVQGLLEMVGLPYVGCGVTGSVLGMDKEKARLILRSIGLPVVDSLCYRYTLWENSPQLVMDMIETRLGYPNFVKPVNLGSSIGVSKVASRTDLQKAIDLALQYDNKFLVEEAIDCRELECSVLGNEDPMVSAVGEVFYTGAFYDYHAKYLDSSSYTMVPASLTPSLAEKIRFFAIQAFQSLDLSGMARIDFFLEKNTERIFINEVNTLPSLTQQCMYPKLCEYSGLSYTCLLDRLIELAFERYAERHRKKQFSLVA